ncbi:type I-D CRISPR-associated helicase Cas3' [Cyanobacterium aponinum FACHB-4101]|uniref:type I-D CRISPR-associated helicase Cas3' n=1 Tax=Cyanobacterium aponinum TaxID=379064 RepID=UPI001681080C|nr:type I-D CRISPR-associated helicase Cas3' [Cyanobacterium aponinum]MBD2392680.1 type I-D CRISPR-associated helicase Cas3' [Cyanobacterium aponinum FACHB-4101]
MYSIKLKPVYSCPADEITQDINLPENWSLSWHQLETFKALNDPNIDVIFNIAMTGDGKSLAAYLKAVNNHTSTLALYPTNELARDQEKQVKDYQDKFKSYFSQVYRLTSAILEEYIETNKLPSKQSGLINVATNNEILLTNPDIFYYICDFRYLKRWKDKHKNKLKGDLGDKLFWKIADYYDLFIFDEFHIFSSAQIASVFNSLLLLKHTIPHKKFLFLSATPNELLTHFLSQSGFNYKIINPMEENKYCFTDNQQNNWRQISYPITLGFPTKLEPNLQSSYNWLVENAESVILKFFQKNPNSKGAIILNSITAVKKLVPFFKNIFEPLGFKVRENTGLTGETEKSKSVEEADLLLGTSTIDVGVDFKINFLIFEGADSGNFIQRFGRVGRHKGFTKYQAYGLIPNFIVERLFEKENHPFIDNQEYDKVSFTQAIKDSYTFVNQFLKYPSRWGSIQATCVYSELLKLKDKYPDSAQKFGQDIQKSFNININKKYGQIQHLIKDGKGEIINEVRSFRGSSQLNCGIYDLTNVNEPEIERFKTYNLGGILSNFIFEWIDKEYFINQAKKAGLSGKRFDNCLCYLKVIGYRDIRENWYFYYPDDITNITTSAQVQVLLGLEIRQPHGSGINKICDRLSSRKLVCYISDYDLTYLRAKLGLPIHFQAYPLADKYSKDEKKQPYTIAFGKSALMLEALLYYWKSKEDKSWIC